MKHPFSWLAGMITIIAFMTMPPPAFARWKAEYAQADPAVRNWYETRDLTPAAQKRFAFKSCCAHSDVVKTKFKVGGAGNDEWWWLDADGKWRRVPDDVIHWNEHAPGGDPVMFAIGSEPTCFYPPDAGI
jgi:hypothetical protein